jgi:hypothetical protein
MIFTPEPVLRQRHGILQQMESGRLTETAAADRLLEADPDFTLPYMVKGKDAAVAGDLDAAEEWFWKAVDRHPCHYFGYWSLADIRSQRNSADALVQHLRYIGLRKLSFVPRIPDETANRFREAFKAPGLDPSDPESYELFTAAGEKHLKQAELSDEQRDRLLPYELLDQLQAEAPSVVEYALIRKIQDNAARIAPLLRAALRVWRGDIYSLSPSAMMFMVALLGEIGAVDIINDLLEIARLDELQVSMHAHWAMNRLARRFPAEAMERFRAAAQGAPASLRRVVAEQLALLENVPDREDALEGLLEGFPAIANSDDAAYLLLIVLFGLEEADQEQRIKRLLPGCEAALSRKPRKLFRKLIDSESVPPTLAFGIDELSIEDVCGDRALLDEPDEDAGYSEDEENDEFEPAPHRAKAVKPGRNDPCWCGSGKKYKKCHLAADEEEDRSERKREEDVEEKDVYDDAQPRPHGDPLHAKLTGRLMDASVEWRSRAESREAQRLFFGNDDAISQEELMHSGFFEWFLYDFRPRRGGKTMVEEYLEKRGSSLSPEERSLLESWRRARYGLYEVQRVEEGTGIELKDLFAGYTFFVHDVSSSRGLVQWDAIFTRIEEWQGRMLFTGNGVVVARHVLREIVDKIETESSAAAQSAAEYVRANSHRWYRVLRDRLGEKLRNLKVVTPEGDSMEFCSATYAVRDQAAAEEQLTRSKIFEETTRPDDPPGVRRFGWLEAIEGPRRSYGNIEVSAGQLRLECNSRRRLEIGRQLIEKCAGQWLEHREDSFQSLESIKEESLRREPRPEPPASKIPPEVEREILHKMKAEHYATWADHPLPALQGKTPREAVKSAAGRRAVEDLLRDFENGEERERKRHGTPFDFGEIRKSLGLVSKER